MKFMSIIALLILSTAVWAGPECTTEPKEKWKDQKEFKAELEKQYKIKVFKVTKGNCYEIYGWNKEGQKVEIYFNPVTGAVVKEKIQK